MNFFKIRVSEASEYIFVTVYNLIGFSIAVHT